MRTRIAYKKNNKDVLEEGQVNNFPRGLWDLILVQDVNYCVVFPKKMLHRRGYLLFFFFFLFGTVMYLKRELDFARIWVFANQWLRTFWLHCFLSPSFRWLVYITTIDSLLECGNWILSFLFLKREKRALWVIKNWGDVSFFSSSCFWVLFFARVRSCRIEHYRIVYSIFFRVPFYLKW